MYEPRTMGPLLRQRAPLIMESENWPKRMHESMYSSTSRISSEKTALSVGEAALSITAIWQEMCFKSASNFATLESRSYVLSKNSESAKLCCERECLSERGCWVCACEGGCAGTLGSPKRGLVCAADAVDRSALLINGKTLAHLRYVNVRVGTGLTIELFAVAGEVNRKNEARLAFPLAFPSHSYCNLYVSISLS